MLIAAFKDEVRDSTTSVYSQFRLVKHVERILHCAMLPLNIFRTLWSPEIMKFQCNRHLVAKLSVELTVELKCLQ